MSAAKPTIWTWTTSGVIPKYSSGSRVDETYAYDHCTVRGPGIREWTGNNVMPNPGSAPVLARARAYLEFRGAKPSDIIVVEGKPPCIFCGQYRDQHRAGGYGEHCRPRCEAPGCSRVTCVQALVGGYLPACLEHFHEERLCERRPGVIEHIVNPVLVHDVAGKRVARWTEEEALARSIAKRKDPTKPSRDGWED